MKNIDNNFLKRWNSIRWNVFTKNSTIILCTWKAPNYDHWQKTLWNRPMIIGLSNKKGEKSVKEITNYYRRRFIEKNWFVLGIAEGDPYRGSLEAPYSGPSLRHIEVYELSMLWFQTRTLQFPRCAPIHRYINTTLYFSSVFSTEYWFLRLYLSR